jgi:hypothetical protein
MDLTASIVRNTQTENPAVTREGMRKYLITKGKPAKWFDIACELLDDMMRIEKEGITEIKPYKKRYQAIID